MRGGWARLTNRRLGPCLIEAQEAGTATARERATVETVLLDPALESAVYLLDEAGASTLTAGLPIGGRQIVSVATFENTPWSRPEAPLRQEASPAAYLSALLVSASTSSPEEGMLSPLARQARRLIQDHGAEAVAAIGRVVLDETRDRQVRTELLLAVGSFRMTYAIRERCELAVAALESPDARVRDAAGLALANIGTSDSLSALREAAAREPVPLLRRNLESALRALE